MEEVLKVDENATKLVNSFITNVSTRANSSGTVDAMDDFDDMKQFERIVGIVIPTIYSFIVFIGVIGNCLVIVVVAVNRRMRNGTNLLIVNLAISDLLFLIFCVPFTAASIASNSWHFSYAWCAVISYLQYVTASASIWTLVLMALNRFVAVVFPLQSLTLCTVRNTFVCVVVLWIVVTLANVFQFQVYDVFEFNFAGETHHECVFIEYSRGTATVNYVRAYYATFVGLAYVAPLFIISVLYCFVLRNLWSESSIYRRRSQEFHVNRLSTENLQAKRKVTRMIAGVTIAFAICWLPMNSFFICAILMYEKIISYDMTMAVAVFSSQTLAYANSCVNPFLYALFSRSFRNGFLQRWRSLKLSLTGMDNMN